MFTFIFPCLGVVIFMLLLSCRSGGNHQNPDYYFKFRYDRLKQCIEQSETMTRLALLKRQIDELYNDFAGRIPFKMLDSGCDELRVIYQNKKNSLIDNTFSKQS